MTYAICFATGTSGYWGSCSLPLLAPYLFLDQPADDKQLVTGYHCGPVFATTYEGKGADILGAQEGRKVARVRGGKGGVANTERKAEGRHVEVHRKG